MAQVNYTVYWDESFYADCAKIHPDQQAFDTMFHGVMEVLERDPFRYSKPLEPNNETFGIRLMRTSDYFSTDEMPTMYVTLRVEKLAPDGAVSVRRVKTQADVRAGLI